MDGQVERIIQNLLHAGIAEQEGPLLQLTIVGFACANSSLSLESVLLHILRQFNQVTATLPRLLALTQALPELDDTCTPLFKNGTKEKEWPHHAAVKLSSDVVRLYQGSLPDATAYLRRAKRALIVAAWWKVCLGKHWSRPIRTCLTCPSAKAMSAALWMPPGFICAWSYLLSRRCTLPCC